MQVLGVVASHMELCGENLHRNLSRAILKIYHRTTTIHDEIILSFIAVVLNRTGADLPNYTAWIYLLQRTCSSGIAVHLT